MILSPLLLINIETTDLDLRNFNQVRDNVTLSASSLDIRNFDGARDSFQINRKFPVEDSDSGTIIALGTRTFLTKDISNYRNNYYLVINTGGVAVTATLQISPVDIDTYYVNSGSQFNILAGDKIIFSPNHLMKYARVSVSALLLGSVIINYFGQS
ncbi:hypothetical protein DP73_05655 [Desulfosporosinus sp. HMP52]|uniref:DUF6385 domain-containing protein n=1 Tax=Desulfosporosinus sp. HMP52 TaxID=1487923 RepID=UPI00051F9434|nr:DUF6385 domain-containing protein [Desulfosporosinus sp. HMP52]KGK90938.1 hypothetical protein DP73_05655 [Desulfosporosinus sp. HMP52]